MEKIYSKNNYKNMIDMLHDMLSKYVLFQIIREKNNIEILQIRKMLKL